MKLFVFLLTLSFLGGCGANFHKLANPVERLFSTNYSPAPVSVTTYRYDNSGNGLSPNETALTPGNVNAANFGKLFSTPVDGQIYAQPLYVGSQVFVATENNSLYAFDADQGQILWHDNFGTPVPAGDTNSFGIAPVIGITGSPVIDLSSKTLFVVAKTKEVSAGIPHYVHRLHAVDLASGSEKFGGPVVIADTSYQNGTYIYNSGPSVSGMGDGSVSGRVSFNSLRESERAALTLSNGVVYVAFASHGDIGPYHGWVLGYSASDLSLKAAFNTTPNGSDGGIWQSAGGLSVDSFGNIYASLGNGTFDASLNAQGFPSSGDYGGSVIKLAVDATSSPTNPNHNGWGLKVIDYFSPSNTTALSAADLDIGSSQPMILPDSAGSTLHPHLLLSGSKAGTFYLMDRDNMGHFQSTDATVQEFPAYFGAWSSPALFGSSLFYVGSYDFGTSNFSFGQSFSLANAHISGPIAQTLDGYGYPGSTPTISSNGSANAIAWNIEVSWSPSLTTGELRAYTAENYSVELFKTPIPTPTKFSVPVVANGNVYVGGANAVSAYGLFATNTRFIIGLYRNILGRIPSHAEIAGWLSATSTNSREQIATLFLGSPEYRSDLIRSFYSNYLHRSPSPTEVNGWTNFWNPGISTETIQSYFLSSIEYYSLNGGSSWNFVQALYRDVLGRTASSQEIGGWVTLLSTISRNQVASEFLGSLEYRERLIASWYQNYLHRSPDSVGMTTWIEYFSLGYSDEAIQSKILGSSEYFGIPH